MSAAFAAPVDTSDLSWVKDDRIGLASSPLQFVMSDPLSMDVVSLPAALQPEVASPELGMVLGWLPVLMRRRRQRYAGDPPLSIDQQGEGRRVLQRLC